jgi:hypothetical protein
MENANKNASDAPRSSHQPAMREGASGTAAMFASGNTVVQI